MLCKWYKNGRNVLNVLRLPLCLPKKNMYSLVFESELKTIRKYTKYIQTNNTCTMKTVNLVEMLKLTSLSNVNHMTLFYSLFIYNYTCMGVAKISVSTNQRQHLTFQRTQTASTSTPSVNNLIDSALFPLTLDRNLSKL